jgi:hypothetical protein
VARRIVSSVPRLALVGKPSQRCVWFRLAQVAFWQRAVEDYQKEFAVITKLGSGFVNNSMVAAQNRIDETAREMNRPFADAA